MVEIVVGYVCMIAIITTFMAKCEMRKLYFCISIFNYNFDYSNLTSDEKNNYSFYFSERFGGE